MMIHLRDLPAVLYGDVQRLMRILPHGWVPPRFWSRTYMGNRTATSYVIRLLKEIGVEPRTLVDCGASRSGWAAWLKREWPRLEIVSFEPNGRLSPLGDIRREALSDADGEAWFGTEEVDETSRLGGKGPQIRVPVRRFDGLGVEVRRPAVLKVDCENCTSKALRGFGERIHEFDLVVVEMWNNDPSNPEFQELQQQAEVWEFMLANGFRKSRVVDAVDTGRKFWFYDIAFWKDRKGKATQ